MVIEIPNYISSTYKMKKQNTVKKQRMPVLPSSKNISTSQTVHDVSPQFFLGGGATAPFPLPLIHITKCDLITTDLISCKLSGSE